VKRPPARDVGYRAGIFARFVGIGRMIAGAAGEVEEVSGSEFVLQIRVFLGVFCLVISCFQDYGVIPELDITSALIHICAARMACSTYLIIIAVLRSETEDYV
jgi:hypothetical protein